MYDPCTAFLLRLVRDFIPSSCSQYYDGLSVRTVSVSFVCQVTGKISTTQVSCLRQAGITDEDHTDTYLRLTEYLVNVGNNNRVKDRGESEVFYEVLISYSYTDRARSQY